jgi:phage regulator Rha-like protein
MSQLIKINDVEIEHITYKDQPVVTFEMIAEVHDISVRTVINSFQRNKEKFTDGKHFYRIDFEEASQLTFKGEVSPNGVTLFTKKGYALLTKPMRDEKSWEVQEQMIDEYFAMRAQATAIPPQSTAEMLLQYAQALVQQEKELLRQQQQLTAVESRVEKIEDAFVPPSGRFWPQDWIVATHKQRLDAALWKVFLAHARHLENAVPFTPPGGAFPRWYYTPKTLEQAYLLATRQLTLMAAGRKNPHEPLER